MPNQSLGSYIHTIGRIFHGDSSTVAVDFEAFEGFEGFPFTYT